MGSVRGNETNLSLRRKRGVVETCLLDVRQFGVYNIIGGKPMW